MPKCKCRICKLLGKLRCIEDKCSESQKAALHELWDMAEDSSTTIELLEAKASEGLPVMIAGKRYCLAMEE